MISCATASSPLQDTLAATALQASKPSAHVCAYFGSPAFPHFSNQLPPREQQLRLPDLVAAPHLGHPGDTAVVVCSVS